MKPTKYVASFLEEFKKFALKGSVIDLAIGVIIGAAFAKIVNSLVFDIIMPVVSIFLPGKNGFESWYLTIWGSKIPYGKFLGEVLNFLIIALRYTFS